MNTYEIKEPIWKDNSIGIADFRLNSDLLINITYTNKKGERVFPDTYIVKKDKILKYPVQRIKGKRLYIIPINDLEIHEK